MSSAAPDLKAWLNALGGLHDVTVTHMSWLPGESRLVLYMKDIYWNCEGYPEYPGPTPGSLELLGVANFSSSVDAAAKTFWIYDCSAERVSGGYLVRLSTDAGEANLRCRAANFPALAFKA